MFGSGGQILFAHRGDGRECRDGGHEITDAVMRALRSGETRFSGEEPCQGTLGAAESQCNGVLVYEAEATYG